MAKCGYCGSTILMGGVQAGAQKFCNKKCYQNAQALNAAQNVPAELITHRLEEVWKGDCPKCKGSGPVDVHKVHQVWSALVLTRWTTQPQVSCKSCATKRQAGGAVFSLLFGWWGFPWGLILTPVQIGRNIAGMVGGPKNTQPSEALRNLVLINIGSHLAAQQKQTPPPPPPLPTNRPAV